MESATPDSYGVIVPPQRNDSAAVEACRLQPTIPGSNSLPLKLPEY
ncbi:MAG: hypothetical protein HY762_00175 [Planctomycetes bacterium]|nr:hypothetical protein [Planctomycetota bacterium]